MTTINGIILKYCKSITTVATIGLGTDYPSKRSEFTSVL